MHVRGRGCHRTNRLGLPPDRAAQRGLMSRHPSPAGGTIDVMGDTGAVAGSDRSEGTVYRHPLAFLLGLEGVALLRAHAGDGFDRQFVEAPIAETRSLLDDAAPAVGQGIEVGQLSSTEGCRLWAPDYDRPGNPLIEVEQPAVRGILDRLRPGAALDAACGTGRHAEYLTGLGHRVIGVDSSAEMLARATQRVPRAGFTAVSCTSCQSPTKQRTSLCALWRSFMCPSSPR